MCFEYRVSSIEFRVSSIEYRVSSLESRVSSIEFRVSSFEFRVSSFDFRVSSFEFRVSSFEYQVSSFEYRVSSHNSQIRVMQHSSPTQRYRKSLKCKNSVYKVTQQSQHFGMKQSCKTHNTYRWKGRRDRVKNSRLPYLCVPLSPNSCPLLCYSHLHVN